MIEKSVLYKEKYGAWAGDPEGQKPDFEHCCVEVYRWPGGTGQCSKKRGYGPEGAYCKQHDPEAVKARSAAIRARSTQKWNEQRYDWHGRTFFQALSQIAEGHNDPRTLAQETIDEFKKGEAT